MATKTKKKLVWISVKAAAAIIGVTTGRVRQIISVDGIRHKPDPNHEDRWNVEKADAYRYRDSPRKPGRQA